jgi:hypothetical protein
VTVASTKGDAVPYQVSPQAHASAGIQGCEGLSVPIYMYAGACQLVNECRLPVACPGYRDGMGCMLK